MVASAMKSRWARWAMTSRLTLVWRFKSKSSNVLMAMRGIEDDVGGHEAADVGRDLPTLGGEADVVGRDPEADVTVGKCGWHGVVGGEHPHPALVTRASRCRSVSGSGSGPVAGGHVLRPRARSPSCPCGGGGGRRRPRPSRRRAGPGDRRASRTCAAAGSSSGGSPSCVRHRRSFRAARDGPRRAWCAGHLRGPAPRREGGPDHAHARPPPRHRCRRQGSRAPHPPRRSRQPARAGRMSPTVRPRVKNRGMGPRPGQRRQETEGLPTDTMAHQHRRPGMPPVDLPDLARQVGRAR